MWFRVVSLFYLLLLWNPIARADVGIVVYESKGVDSRRTNSGHVALAATNLCVDGMDRVRTCQAGEEPGVVVTRYLHLAYGHDGSVFVVPMRAHFNATGDPGLIPVLTNDETLEAMQISYWREHLRPYLPTFTPERYTQLARHFDPTRTVRGIVSLESVLGALESHKNSPTGSIALVDPLTKELLPNGNWREAIGAAHVRSSMLITAPASPEQERRLVGFIARVNKQPFQALADNCSDFVERALTEVFGDTGLRFRPRETKIADAWVTSPLSVATDFLRFAKNKRIPISVQLIPMIAGTRPPTARIHSLTRGALVPDPSQGKVLFGAKLAMNAVNPLLGVAAYTADKLSRFGDLEQLQHDRGSVELSRLAYTVQSGQPGSAADIQAWQREKIRVFGTSSCWKAKEDGFRTLAAAAEEEELLSPAERKLLLRQDRPFLLPRLYARSAEQTDTSMSNGFGAGRPEIRRMADSSDTQERVKAYRMMLPVINYDLSSEPLSRRTSQEFDQDWTLFLTAARKNGLNMPLAGPANPGGGGLLLPRV